MGLKAQTNLPNIAGYQLEALLGEGAMGLVYRAKKGDQCVALKVLRSDLAGNPELVARFQQEGQIASHFQHHNIVRTGGLGTAQGRPYFEMEALAGEALDQRINKLGKLEFLDALEIGKQLCLALEAVHEQRVVHRDIKPENILLTQDGHGQILVKLIDFGIAVKLDETLLESNRWAGTPCYMSPEQCRGVDVGIPSDIYSLGVVLFEMTTGRAPFVGESSTAMMLMHLTDEPSKPSGQPECSQLPPEFDNLVAGCLLKESRLRFQSAREVYEALCAIERSLGTRSGVYRVRATTHTETVEIAVDTALLRSSSSCAGWSLPRFSKRAILALSAAAASLCIWA